jgi:hypothetical protein
LWSPGSTFFACRPWEASTGSDISARKPSLGSNQPRFLTWEMRVAAENEKKNRWPAGFWGLPVSSGPVSQQQLFLSLRRQQSRCTTRGCLGRACLVVGGMVATGGGALRRVSFQISLSLACTGAALVQELLFLRPPHFFDRRLSLQGRRFRRLGLAVGQPDGKPAAGVFRRPAGSVGLQPLGQVVGDTRVERAVGAAQQVDEPARGRGAGQIILPAGSLDTGQGRGLGVVIVHPNPASR